MRTRSLQALKALALSGACLTAVATAAHATVSIYDGFDYGPANFNIGSLTSSMNGGTGLSGSWALNWVNTNDRGSYLADGLNFGMLAVKGGAIQTEGQWSGSSWIVRPVNVTLTGTVWGSFLVRPGPEVAADPNADSAGLTIGAKGSTAYPADMDVSAKLWNDSAPLAGGKIGQNQGAPYGTSGSPMIYDNQHTYLELFKITNLGGAGSKTIATWILTPDQYAYFKTNALDPLTETELNAASLGTAANNVLQRNTYTSSNTAELDPTKYLNFYTTKAQTSQIWTNVYDEIRFSTTSLDAVALWIPEPSTALLLIAGAVLLLGNRAARGRFLR